MTNSKHIPKRRFKEFESNGEWELLTLSDISEGFEYGLNVPAKEFDGVNKYLRITDIDDTSREFLISNLSSPDANCESLSNYLLAEGDILFARTGASTGKTYYYKETDGKVFFAGFLIRARVKGNFDHRFVFQNTLTKRYKNYIELTSQRSGQPGVNAQEYSRFSLNIPSLSEQKVIGDFVEKLDSLISKHQHKLDKLKNLKKAYLSEMFPAEGERVPKRRFPGFEGEWEEKKLFELADVEGGGTPSTVNPQFWDGDIDWYTPAEIDERVFVDRSKRKITNLGLAKSSAKMLPIGTVLFTSRAGIGKTAILAREGCTNQGFQSIIPKEGLLDSYFIYSLSNKLKSYGERIGAGSTFVEVSGKQMSEMSLIIPSIFEQKQIGNFFNKLDQSISLQQQKLDKLNDLKKAYLNELFV